jgi:hypothetical protein
MSLLHTISFPKDPRGRDGRGGQGSTLPGLACPRPAGRSKGGTRGSRLEG